MIEVLRSAAGRVVSTGHVRWSEFAWPALAIAASMLAAGMIFVSVMATSPGNPDVGGVDFDGHRQKVLVALPVFFVGLFLRPSWLKKNAALIYAACVVLLALVPFIGDERNNARRWIQLPRFDLQPSELAKIGLILMLARVLHENPLRDARDWAKPLVVTAVPMLLVAVQPDLGTAMTMVPVSLGLLYLAGASGRAIGALVVCVALFGGVVWKAGWVQPYQLERIETWVESFDTEELIASRNGHGFHTYHARTFTGNGGAYGRGLGGGVANETGLLPERDCDSIIAVIGEESGFAGTSLVILLYGYMVALLMLHASRLRDRFSRLTVAGVAIYFAAHLVINVSVNIGLLPMTGLTLPLLSTGGSSLLATFLALGIALGLASHHERSLGGDAFRAY
ncbi:MAG: FtsW/RodA/SpoVE family cell cycle protein [Planctomycetota bacterium]